MSAGPPFGGLYLNPPSFGGLCDGVIDDSVREVRLAAAIVGEDGPRDHRRRRHAVVALNDGVDIVRRQDFERGPLRGIGNRVRVLAHV